MALFASIPKFHEAGGYRTNVEWGFLSHHLEHWMADDKITARLDLEPDFQRAHVWTPAQQTAYVEFIIRGGYSGKELYFNCVGWMGSFKGPFVIVDGKQRLQAVRRFLRNEIPAFGCAYEAYEDRLPTHCEFVMNVNNLKTRAAVLEWYLQLNTGGVVHTDAELKRVEKLLAKEKGK